MKIGIIATYLNMLEVINGLTLDPDITLVVEEAIYSRAVDKLQIMEQQGIEAVISRGATCSYIEKYTSLPVVHCDYGLADILYAVRKASQLGDRICVLSYSSCQWMKPIIEDFIGKEVLFRDGYQNIRENQECVTELKKQGVQVIVGGIASVEAARHYGMDAVLIEVRPETVVQAINEACKVVKAVRKERSELERLNQIINGSSDAVILTDCQGKVLIMNQVAKNFVNAALETEELKSIFELVPSLSFRESILSGASNCEKIRTIKNKLVLVRQTPIIRDGNTEGIVFSMQDSGKIQNMEYLVRNHLHNVPSQLKYAINSFIGESHAAQECRKKIESYAKSDGTVLISGETGTGKEIVAQSLHISSRRNSGPFVAVNCSAIESSLLESELFGYSEGAFTGAKKGGKEGLFEIAHNGTIFLDEIGDISLEAQSSLLRVIQEKEIRRVGGSKTIPVDVRIVAATNKNLQSMVDLGKFRIDLYYRLKVLEIHTPTLAERTEDIPMLVKHFCQQLMVEFSLFSPRVLDKMQQYNWPGNVRELRNFVEKVSLLDDALSADYLFDEYVDVAKYVNKNSSSPDTYADGEHIVIRKGTMQSMEEEILRKMYAECDYNKSKLASVLNISRVTINNKLKK